MIEYQSTFFSIKRLDTIIYHGQALGSNEGTLVRVRITVNYNHSPSWPRMGRRLVRGGRMLSSGGRGRRLVRGGRLEGNGKLVSGMLGKMEVTDGKMLDSGGKGGNNVGVGTVTSWQSRAARSPCKDGGSARCDEVRRVSLTRVPSQQTVDPSQVGVGARGLVLMSNSVQFRPTWPSSVVLRPRGNASVRAVGRIAPSYFTVS